MKKIFTLLSLMGIITSGFAQWNGGDNRGPKYDSRNDVYKSSALVINAFTEKRFTVMVDNMQYQINEGRNGKRYDNSINLGAINAGRHTVTVYETKSGFFGKQKQKVVYSSPVFLKPGMETALNINNYGQINVSEKKLFQNGRDDRRDDRRDDKWDDRRH